VTFEITPHTYSDTACPFCAATVAQSGTTTYLGCPTWRCACGGLGVGGQPMDIDESLDELEATIGLARGTLGGAPTLPVGTSGMISASYIDPDAMTSAAIAAAPAGWQVGRSRATLSVTVPPGTAERRYDQLVIWARRTGEPGAIG
jgi:hypothetical protein